MSFPLIVVVAACTALGVLVLYSLSVSTAFLVFSTLYVLPLMNLAWLPIDTRLLAMLVAVSQLPRLRSVQAPASSRVKIPLAMVFALVFALYSALSARWSINPLDSLNSAVAVIAAIVGYIVFANLIDYADLTRIILILCSLVCALSVLVWLAFPDIGVEGGRMRGVVENANGLGTFAAFGAVIAVSSKRRTAIAALPFILIIVLTGSRGALLASLVGVLIAFLLPEPGRTVRPTGRVIVAFYLSLSAYLSWFAFKPDWVIFRTNDSRSEVWRSLVDYIQAYWPLGSGAATLVQFSTNSYLNVLAELGAIGILLMVAFLLASLFAGGLRHPSTAYWATGATASVFESWLMVGGSFYTLMFFILSIPVASVSLKNHSCKSLLIGDPKRASFSDP